MAYAVRTEVGVEKTRVEIERLLTKAGATKIATFTEPTRAAIIFEMKDRRLRFVLALVTSVTRSSRSRMATSIKLDQIHRSQWRALLLCIKAKMESVASGIETFEEAFLAHVVTSDNQTVYEHVRPRLDQIYKSGDMVPLLPAPGR